MSDETWTQWKHDQRVRRAKRLPVRTDEILALKRQGYSVEQKSDYHFRINGILDIWPIHNRWHDLRTQERGGAKCLAVFVKERILPQTNRKDAPCLPS